MGDGVITLSSPIALRRCATRGRSSEDIKRFRITLPVTPGTLGPLNRASDGLGSDGQLDGERDRDAGQRRRSRLGPPFRFRSLFSLRVFGTFECSSNMERVHVLFGQDLDRFLLVERHRALELSRPDARVDLGCIDSRVSQERADLLKVMVLLENFHRHTMAQVVGLELG
jgi:hypothetical protein